MQKIYLLLLLAMTSTSSMIAQSPGGVSDSLKLWIKTNVSSALVSSDSLDAWTYANDNTKQFTAIATSRPIVLTAGTGTGINFLPVVNFGGNKMMDGPTGINAPIPAGHSNYCLFAVWRSTATGVFQRVWSQRQPNSFAGDGFSLATWNDNRFGDQLEANPFDQGLLQTYVTSQWNISQVNLLDQSTNDLEIRDPLNVNGAPLTATTVSGGSSGRSISDISNRLGARDNSINETLFGDIAEIIVYDTAILNSTTRNQIFSYLSLKYGLNKAGNFIASDGTTVTWDSTANSSFRNSIFGIGRDDNAGLSVTQSNSIETGSGNGEGQSGKGNIVLSGASNQDNLEFLLIGNDNAALTETNSDLPPSADATTRRLTREWKVQHTGNLGTVNLSFDFTGITVSGTIGSTTDFYLMIDDDGDGDFTTGHTSFVAPASFTGNVANFTGVTLNNNVVFSIVTLASPATLPVTWKSFNAIQSGSDILLNWSVENNEQGKSFEVQHATVGNHFAGIGTIANNVQLKNYSFVHPGVSAGVHYYRIYQVDVDGKSTYSKTVSVNVMSTDFSVNMLSNPVRNSYAQIDVVSARSSSAVIEIWSVTGALISSQQKVINTGHNRIAIAMGNVATGNYLLKVKTGQQLRTLRLLKQ